MVASMAAIAITKLVAAPRPEVWAELERIESHTEWMADAVALEFETEQQRGAGTRISVATKVGPFRTTDRMEFTSWDPPRSMGVRHQGLVGGTGEFSLEERGADTLVTWRENLEFPWYFGGAVGAWTARPMLRFIWKRNLDRLAARF